MRDAEGTGSRVFAALRMTALGICAVLLGGGGAKALPTVSFPVNSLYSSLNLEVSVAGYSDDQTVDLGGAVGTELLGILGPSPGLGFTGATLDVEDVDLSIPGATLPILVSSSGVEAVLSGGPVWGTPVGGPGFEGQFELAGVTLTLTAGSVVSQVGTVRLPTIDFSLAPVAFALDAADSAWLSATAVGGGLYDYMLALSFDGTQTISLLSTLEADITVSATVVGAAQAAPEPGTATLVGLGLAALALARARRR